MLNPLIAADHLHVGGGLVEEHELIWVEIELALEPRQTRCLHILTFLLDGITGIYAHDAVVLGKKDINCTS